MSMEKLVNSKINTWADWIIRIVVLNVMVVTCALLLVTAYPALSAGYNRFSDYLSGKESGLVGEYLKTFKRDFFRKMRFGIVLMGLFLLGFFNLRYYVGALDATGGTLSLVGYYVSLVLLTVLSVMTLYTLTVMKVNPSLKIRVVFKVAFYLAGKYFLKTILLIAIVLVPVLLLLHPITAVVFVFAGVSGPLLINVWLTREAVSYLERLGVGDAARY